MAAGEPVDRGNDLFGSTVNLASRICDAAGGGQILVSDIVQDLGGPLGFRFLEAGLRTLKGFLEPRTSSSSRGIERAERGPAHRRSAWPARALSP